MTNLYFLLRSPGPGPAPAFSLPRRYTTWPGLPWDDTMYNCFHNIYYFVPPTKNYLFHHLYLKTSHSHHWEAFNVGNKQAVCCCYSWLEARGREGAPPDIKQRMVCSLLPLPGLPCSIPGWLNSNCISALPALAWLQLNAAIIMIIVIASCSN